LLICWLSLLNNSVNPLTQRTFLWLDDNFNLSPTALDMPVIASIFSDFG